MVSSALMAELADVMSRPRMRKWFDPEDGRNLAAALEAVARVVEPSVTVSVCRDPNDNYLLALAESADANYLVTRDEDLLILRDWRRTRITYPAEFLKLLAAVE